MWGTKLRACSKMIQMRWDNMFKRYKCCQGNRAKGMIRGDADA